VKGLVGTYLPTFRTTEPPSRAPSSKMNFYWDLETLKKQFFLRLDNYVQSRAREIGVLGKTGVTADCDKIEFRLFNSSSIFNITLREELRKTHNQGNSGLQLLSKKLDSGA